MADDETKKMLRHIEAEIRTLSTRVNAVFGLVQMGSAAAIAALAAASATSEGHKISDEMLERYLKSGLRAAEWAASYGIRELAKLDQQVDEQLRRASLEREMLEMVKKIKSES